MFVELKASKTSAVMIMNMIIMMMKVIINIILSNNTILIFLTGTCPVRGFEKGNCF